MEKIFKIEGMTCASCVVLNQNSLNDLKWMNKVQINLATNEAKVEYDEAKVSFSEIQKQVEDNWFKVNTDFKKEKSKDDGKVIFNRFIYSLIFSLPVFSMMFVKVDWIVLYIFALLSAIVVFWFGGHFHKSAYKSLKKLHFNMDSLVSLWTLTAFFYSIIVMFLLETMLYFEAAVAIITLINLWKYLEYKAKSKAWDAIWKLLELQAKKANIVSDWKIIEKDIDNIEVWEIIEVKSWEKIALDWVIVSWSANIDESMLTWESIPVYKKEKSGCYWATINLDGVLHIKVTKTNKNSTLANIIKMVDEAQSSKAPIQHLADKVSGIFVPVIIVVSVITFITWYYITWDISKAIVPAVASLVIACPCALWLATPTAIMVGTWVWAKKWILIKNAETLEKTKDIDIIVFDKTGTLTNWKPKLTDVISLKETQDKLLKIAKSLAKKSHHPLSKSITDYTKNIKEFEVKDFKEIKGKWITWIIEGQELFLWNKKLFEKQKIDKDLEKNIEKLSSNWKTPVLIWNKEEVLWIIALLDTAKSWAKDLVKKLHSMNIEVVMLTWDNKNTAKAIAKDLDIKQVIAEVLPEDKLNTIKDIKKSWKKVAFVWDGINDAAWLVESDLWISMWTGSDIAIESSDIVLVWWDIEKVVSSINLSRKTLSTIKQNLFWAFIYNTIWIPLAALWILNPIFAAFAMSMSSVSVVSNSLRLRKI